MNPINIFFDADYPPALVESIQQIHELQSERIFEVDKWDNSRIEKVGHESSVFLLIDYKKRGVSEHIIKHVENGMRIFVCRAPGDLDYFEFAMTILRVWPFIIEKGQEVKEPCCFTFSYGGRKLNRVKLEGHAA
ncbi:MAG: hypothetical protein RIE86_20405 [Imperialibacter sp.]|uniref:hypothetical protein n=1 Tax=Imperialibacter sp. TaxID=2038411 RepID=UPI0032EB76F8